MARSLFHLDLASSPPGRSLLLCALVTLQLISPPARADEDAVDVNVVGATLAGHGWPQLVVEVHAPIRGVRVHLKRSDGKEVQLSAGKVGRDGRVVFGLPQPNGGFHYDGTIEAIFKQGPSKSLPASFDTAVMPPPQVKASDHAVDLQAHTVTVSADRAVSDVHIRVLADDGHVVDELSEQFPDAKGGDPLLVHWHEGEPATVLSIEVRVTDKYGFFQDLALYPWRLDIPHEDVLFDTGKSDILAAEEPKLGRALSDLNTAIDKYGRFVKVHLFVAGCTDTVGDSASNKVLSESRATSIGRWFRKHGVRIPISVTGYGEDGLLIPTPDETPEPRNRRAIYIVTVEPPPGARWTALP
jgi:hypothetical protein